MMTLFILRFIVFSGALYLCYLLLFSRMSFLRLNRFTLLLVPVVSLLIPALAPYFEAPEVMQPQLQFLLNEITIGTAQPAENVVAQPGISGWTLLYLAGAAFVLLSILAGLYRGWLILKRAQPAYENVHISEEASGPFAFFHRIVIPKKLWLSDKLQTVIAHEKAHVEQNHGYDNLYYNLLCAVFWFNPFMHLLHRELRQTHECLADEAALDQSSRESYAELILSSAFGSELHFDAANRFFNSSLIKTRITMMYKSKTNTKMKSLYLALLPLLAVMVMISCQKTEPEATTQQPVEEKAMLGFAEADQPPLFENCDANASKEEQLKCFQEGIMKHVMENFKYPEKAQEQKLEGRMYVKFVISESGKVEQVEIANAQFPEEADPATTKEAKDGALKLVQELPKMAPALKDGKEVPVSFVLPINMKLS